MNDASYAPLEACFDAGTGRFEIAGYDHAGRPVAYDRIGGLQLAPAELTEFPAEVWRCTRLRKLFLTINQLGKIPDEIGDLVHLDELVSEMNPIRRLSANIGKLIGLKVLWIDNGALASVPEEIGFLVNLQTLRLGNELTAIPASLGQCTRLERLNLKKNRLTTLPDSVGHLAGLRQLDLSENSFKELPALIGGLQNLVRLEAYGNPLSQLPWFALDLPQLEAMSCCNFCVSTVEAVKFSAACQDRGLRLVWNRHCGESIGAGNDASA